MNKFVFRYVPLMHSLSETLHNCPVAQTVIEGLAEGPRVLSELARLAGGLDGSERHKPPPKGDPGALGLQVEVMSQRQSPAVLPCISESIKLDAMICHKGSEGLVKPGVVSVVCLGPLAQQKLAENFAGSQ